MAGERQKAKEQALHEGYRAVRRLCDHYGLDATAPGAAAAAIEAVLGDDDAGADRRGDALRATLVVRRDVEAAEGRLLHALRGAPSRPTWPQIARMLGLRSGQAAEQTYLRRRAHTGDTALGREVLRGAHGDDLN